MANSNETFPAKFVLAIGSGKGGVGKSTVAYHLANTLKEEGYQVGLADLDLYGPSQAYFLNAQDSAQTPLQVDENKHFFPVVLKGLKTISISYLLEKNEPVIWRGPIASRAMEQLIFQTTWGSLDFLILDLPPGTGDIVLSLCQKVPLTGAVLVSTPHSLAFLDVEKAFLMFQKLQIPTLGVIENMYEYTCLSCGSREAIFSGQAVDRLQSQYKLERLGRLPILKQPSDFFEACLPIVRRLIEKSQILLGEPILCKVKDTTGDN